MKSNRPYFLFLCSILFCSALTGCGYREETESGTNPYAAATSMESTPIVDYAVPQMSANILVDLNGYPTNGRKQAAVKGRELPQGFQLVDAESGESVYQGLISDIVYDQELDLYLGAADFSDFTQAGSYYLECGIIGQSYRFELTERWYEDLFEESYELLLEECEAGTLPVVEAVILLEAYEWYGDLFPDMDGNNTPDVLEGLRSWVSHMEAEGVEDEETALYAAFLAKFSYNYKNFERQYATDCLKRASTVFGQLQNTDEKDLDNFFALTELYRAANLYTYRNQIASYESFFEDNSGYLEEIGFLYGAMTYMTTRQWVDMELCETFMESIMGEAEEISNCYEEMIHPVTAKNNGTEEVLKYALEVSCANYVTNNIPYTNILEEFLHYLMGKNLESVSFYDQNESKAEYLLLLAQLITTAQSLEQGQ